GLCLTALLVERSPPWLSWSALIRDVSDFSRAVVVAHVGGTGEPVVRSVKVKTITDLRSWRSRESLACGSTTVNPAADTSRHMRGRGTSLSCLLTGLLFTSTL